MEAGSEIAGQPVCDVEDCCHGLRVVGFRQAGDEMVILPQAGSVITGGGHLVAMGGREDLMQLARLAQRNPEAG